MFCSLKIWRKCVLVWEEKCVFGLKIWRKMCLWFENMKKVCLWSESMKKCVNFSMIAFVKILTQCVFLIYSRINGIKNNLQCLKAEKIKLH